MINFGERTRPIQSGEQCFQCLALGDKMHACPIASLDAIRTGSTTRNRKPTSRLWSRNTGSILGHRSWHDPSCESTLSSATLSLHHLCRALAGKLN